MPFDSASPAARADAATRPLRLLWLPEDPADAGAMLALRALGHGVVPFLPDAGGPMRPWSSPLLGLARGAGVARQLAAPAAAMAAGCRVAHAATRSRCGHIHAVGAGTAAAAVVGARIAGLTVSVALADAAPDFGRAALRAVLDAADLVLAPSLGVAESLRRIAPGLRLRLVPHGVDATRLLPAAADAPRNGRLLAAGPLVAANGFDVLLSALARLPRARRPSLDILGQGPLRQGLERRAEALGIDDTTRFLGARPASWLARQGNAYLGMVLPMSAPVAGADAAPGLAKAGLALGLPVLATALPGLAEVIAPEVGHLVPAGDVAALAEALFWLGRMPAQRRQAIGAAGRERAELLYSTAGEARGLASALAALSA